MTATNQIEIIHRKALEWLGDKIFSLAAIEIIEETQPSYDSKRLFHWNGRLITNHNLSGGGCD